MNKRYVQFGCGLCAPDGWCNFDASPRLRLERNKIAGLFLRKPLFPVNCKYGDVVKGLPLERGSCDVIYSSHVLEHLSLNDFRLALRNVYALLKPGGVFRSVVPDLEQVAQSYLDSQAEDRAIIFLKAVSLGKEKRPRSLIGVLREAIANSYHLWMWDYVGLEAELKNVGFTNIRMAAFGDSNDAMIDRVETKGRWELAVGFQCNRP